jgi:hypothetical protein
MPWESIGDCGHSTTPGDTFEFKLGIEYLKLVCGKVPKGCELGVMWRDFDGMEYGEIISLPSEVGLFWDANEISDAPWEYISRCETALSIFHESVNWCAIHPDAVNAQIRENEASNDADEELEDDMGEDSDTGPI